MDPHIKVVEELFSAATTQSSNTSNISTFTIAFTKAYGATTIDAGPNKYLLKTCYVPMVPIINVYL